MKFYFTGNESSGTLRPETNSSIMKNKLINTLAIALLISFFITSCTDPKLKQQMADLQIENASLLDSLKNCSECGAMPSDLVEMDESMARAAWNKYKTDSKAEKILGTWLDQGNNWYLYCTYKSNIYSGIGLNESNCPMVIYAIQLVTDKDTTYKFYALEAELSAKDCKAERIAGGSGTCPVRCP